jgi:hypothetical protein
MMEISCDGRQLLLPKQITNFTARNSILQLVHVLELAHYNGYMLVIVQALQWYIECA